MEDILNSICKEKELVNAVETFLKLECYELYINNNLKEVFEKARHDEEIKSKVLNSFTNFLYN